MMSIIYEMIRLSFEDTLLGSAELSNPVSSNFFHKKWWNREGKMQDLKTYLQLSAWGSVTQCKIFPIPYGTTQKIKRFWQLFLELQEMPRGWVFLNRNQELTASWPVIRTGRCPNDLGQSLLDRPDTSQLLHLQGQIPKASLPASVPPDLFLNSHIFITISLLRWTPLTRVNQANQGWSTEKCYNG